MTRSIVSRIALALALSGAAAALPPSAVAKESAPKVTFSPGFAKAAADLDKQMGDAGKNPAVSAATQKLAAATTPADKQAATAAIDALVPGAKDKLAAASAAASTPGDKLKLGELTRNVGVIYNDLALQHQGLVMMVDSGVLPAESTGQVQFLAGVTAYQSGDYQGAVKYLKPAVDSGYKDPQGQIALVLADAYKRTGNTAAVADMTNKELADAKAAGTKPSETAIRTALQAAYDAKNAQQATDLSVLLVQDYPGQASWQSATGVVRAMNPLPTQDNLDMMRLMARTDALQDKRDYLEYIEDADPRRLPGETLKIIDAGIAAGKLTSADVADYRSVASGRLSADKASLPGLERDASVASASGTTVSGAADAFLSYGQPAKAETFYKSALAKPGIDKNRMLTRIGIAQVDQARYADAQASFGEVTGPRAGLAKLWSTYAASKAGGGAAAAPATPPAGTQ